MSGLVGSRRGVKEFQIEFSTNAIFYYIMLVLLNKTIHDYMYSYEDFLFYMKEKLGDHWDDYIKFRDDNWRGDE